MDRIASARRADPFSLPAKDRARLDSLVEASIAELSDAPSIPRSFLARPRRAFEADPDFGSPDTTPRPVPRSSRFVSCHNNPELEAITGPDPVGVIQAANTRAIELLDYVIRDLQEKRSRIRAGATTAEAVEDIPVRESLRTRFGMNADDRSIWTTSGARTVLTLIRRFRGARQILADGSMNYTCVGPGPGLPSVPLGNCGRVRCEEGDSAVTCPANSRIMLCRPFWDFDPIFQAATLLHEALHIYFGFLGDEEQGNFTNAHCYEQFVLDLNWLDVQAGFVGSCP